MALGALIVVAVLAVAAIEGTRFLKARAGGDQTAQTTTTDSTNAVAPSAPATERPDAGWRAGLNRRFRLRRPRLPAKRLPPAARAMPLPLQ